MRLFCLALLLFIPINACAQEAHPETATHKAKFFIYWGWNRDSYTPSDIHFKGNEYDFTLYRVVAHDHQSVLALDPYVVPRTITIPQTNVRLGYFLNDHWSLSLGLDHMKYVMDQDQTANITGTIQN